MPPKIAAIGDSLTQGFHSLAVSTQHSLWSYPAIVARAMKLDVPLDFRVARVPGDGLPLNLENCLRDAESATGSSIRGLEWMSFAKHVRRYLDGVEDYYERRLRRPPTGFGGIYHNLAVWGYTVCESLRLTPRMCGSVINNLEGWIDDDILGIPSAPMHRTATMVLNPRHADDRMDRSQIGMLELLCEHEAPDVLLIWLGANDCLGTVLSLEIREMGGDNVPDDPVERMTHRWNLTNATVFERDFQALADRVSKCVPKTTKVFVATVPHVTIPPITTGVGKLQNGYYERYGRFFVNDGNAGRFTKVLTRNDAQRIDHRINEFNEAIVRTAQSHRWFVVDTCAALDELAVRRNGFANPGQALLDYYTARKRADHPLLQLDPVPSILMLSSKDGRRTGGGLFSLDGVHPSTIGYGIVAELFLTEMQRAGVPGADPLAMPWQAIIDNDTLLQPPLLWEDVVGFAERNAELWDLLFRSLD